MPMSGMRSFLSTSIYLGLNTCARTISGLEAGSNRSPSPFFTRSKAKGPWIFGHQNSSNQAGRQEMTTYVMTRLAISSHERRKGTPSICHYYGKPIQEGDLCVKRLHSRRDRRIDYVQAKCDEEGFRYGRKN